MLHANFTTIFSVEPELLPIEVLHCGNFALFCCCDLDLDSMTFIYELDTPKIYPQTKNFYVKAVKSYRITYTYTHIQTDREVPPKTGWLRSTVGGTPVFGRRTDPVLRSACS